MLTIKKSDVVEYQEINNGDMFYFSDKIYIRVKDRAICYNGKSKCFDDKDKVVSVKFVRVNLR